MSHVYCTECGFQNPEAANYCSRCGALLEKGEPHAETTQAFSPEEVGELARDPVEGLEGPALVVRSGGGRAGESFRPSGERTRIGRSPECEVFLDDEGLLNPQRTRGGYRVFSEDDLERLTTILRLQRDEFLPLRVIRDELSAPGVAERKRRRPAGLAEGVQEIDLDELCRRAGVSAEFARDLDSYGLLAGEGGGSDKRYPETDADVAAVCAQLTRFGVDARHLRTFRTATDRAAAHLEQP